MSILFSIFFNILYAVSQFNQINKVGFIHYSYKL